MINNKKLFLGIVTILVVLVFFLLNFITGGFSFLTNTSHLFPNKGLEEVIRAEINKPVGEIKPEDCLGITSLDLSLSDTNTNLEGLQYFTDLEILISEAGKIKDLSAISNLKKLKVLQLYLNNIKDLSPLENLNNLEYLDLSNNLVKDVSPLAKLKNLKEFVIYKNYVQDFSELSNLNDLKIYE